MSLLTSSANSNTYSIVGHDQLLLSVNDITNASDSALGIYFIDANGDLISGKVLSPDLSATADGELQLQLSDMDIPEGAVSMGLFTVPNSSSLDSALVANDNVTFSTDANGAVSLVTDEGITISTVSFDSASYDGSSGLDLDFEVWSGNVYDRTIQDDNPVAFWSLREASGTSAENEGSIGSSVNGTYLNGPTLGEDSLVAMGDGAVRFDGVNDGITWSNHADINTSSSYSQKTIELWFNADDLNGQQVIYEQGGGVQGLNIYLNGGDLTVGAWANRQGKWLSTGVEANETYHVVLVFDQGQLSGYVNGELFGTASTNFSAMTAHGGKSAIGYSHTYTRLSSGSTMQDLNFAGVIDDVALYNSALSAERVAEHYGAGTNEASATAAQSDTSDSAAGGSSTDDASGDADSTDTSTAGSLEGIPTGEGTETSADALDTDPIALSEIAQDSDSRGFAINGESSLDYSGTSVSNAGDVNGDGLDDFIIGAPGADPNGNSSAGRSYVIFGKADGSTVELSDIAGGIGGFVINGHDGSQNSWSGASVSGAGDINNDGLADLIVGAPGSFDTYVVFGKADGSAVELSDVANGTGGFLINAQGTSVSNAGDVNGDGYSDLIIGEFEDDVQRVIFGKADGSVGTEGFVINGGSSADEDVSVSGAGDVNGDGLSDLFVGAPNDQSAGASGRAYVVFGKTDNTAVDLSNLGSDGFVIDHETRSDWSHEGMAVGFSVSDAGDVNGDGLSDLIVGTQQGAISYVIFGKADSSTVELNDIVNSQGGFAIEGGGNFDSHVVGRAGDINGDGYDDLMVATPDAGDSYIVFGKADDTTTVNLDNIAAGVGGFVLNGSSTHAFAEGDFVGSGDFNGDGFTDLLIGASGASPNGNASGQSYSNSHSIEVQ